MCELIQKHGIIYDAPTFADFPPTMEDFCWEIKIYWYSK